ncbi:type II toxin-antitoxin system RelE/ParE family toxin [Actinophytocola sp. NPDC049390]|uniref:type II toxin-antitoxin system RelE/ParE family toxin n=1 Tax=Actinophytocola sp. NPDC049390 TaxID=3363894 RepID=UPI0037944753
MTYKIDIDPSARDQIRVLPAVLLKAFTEVVTMLELTPWNGPPYVRTKPTGNIRQLTFGDVGSAIVVYMILEEQRRVDVLKVIWVG